MAPGPEGDARLKRTLAKLGRKNDTVVLAVQLAEDETGRRIEDAARAAGARTDATPLSSHPELARWVERKVREAAEAAAARAEGVRSER